MDVVTDRYLKLRQLVTKQGDELKTLRNALLALDLRATNMKRDFDQRIGEIEIKIERFKERP